MTIKKRIISFIILNVLCFTTITSLYFNTSVCAESITDYGSIFSTFTRLVGANEDVPINVLDSLVFDAICPRDAGIIVRPVSRVNYELTKKCIATYLNQKYSNQDKNKDNIDQSDINEFSHDIAQNITYSDESTTYNDNSKSIVNLCINEYKNDIEPGYLYSVDLGIDSNKTWIPDGQTYTDLVNMIQNYRDDYYILLHKYNLNTYRIYYWEKEKYPYFGLIGNTYQTSFIVKTHPFDLNTKTDIRQTADFRKDYSVSSHTLTDNSGVSITTDCGGLINYTSIHGFDDYNSFFISYGETIGFRWFKDVNNANASNIIYSNYYINKPIYNNWNSSTGDYIVTNDNSNKVTYGDVTNYIDDHHKETGDYPSIDDVFKWIQEQPIVTPSPDNPSGGGTVSGGVVNNNNPTLNNNPSISNNPVFNNNPNINVTLFPSVSGNGLNGGTVSGNGGSGSSGNFFDWLGRVGDVIGNLIKGIGEALTGIFEGVAEAVTTIMESIPNILSPLFEFIFGGLPEEIKSLMTLGITCVIFIGVVKAIKR